MLEREEFKRNGIRPENWIKRTIVEGLIKYGASSINIEGEDNLLTVQQRVEDGLPLIAVSNHLTNGDGPIIRSVLQRYGFTNPIFILGEKLKRNPVTNFFIGAANTIEVWPPSLPPRNQEEIKKRKAMNEKAFRASEEALSGGHVLVMFPEGGRSYDHVLHEGLPQVGQYFHLADGLEILPIGIWEIEKRLPRKRGWPHRGPVFLSVGAPIKASALEGFGMRSRVGRRAMVDNVMRKVAQLLPQEYRGFYRDGAIQMQEKNIEEQETVLKLGEESQLPARLS